MSVWNEKVGLVFTFLLGIFFALLWTSYPNQQAEQSAPPALPIIPPLIPISDLPGVDALELVRLFGELFEGKEVQKPHFLVIFGPPGSGKTRIVQKLMRVQNAKRKNYAEIMVDRMLRRITPYASQMDALLLNRSALTAAEFLRQSQAIYGSFRPLVKYFSAMLLDIALRQGLNVLFETTGSNVSLTIQTVVAAKNKGYDIQVVYPYVTTQALLERVDKRNNKIGRAIPFLMVQTMAKDARKNFLELLQYADRATVYDNNIAVEADLLELFSKQEFDPRQRANGEEEEEDEEHPHFIPDKYIRLGHPTHTYKCSDQLEQYPELTQDLMSYCKP